MLLITRQVAALSLVFLLSCARTQGDSGAPRAPETRSPVGGPSVDSSLAQGEAARDLALQLQQLVWFDSTDRRDVFPRGALLVDSLRRRDSLLAKWSLALLVADAGYNSYSSGQIVLLAADLYHDAFGDPEPLLYLLVQQGSERRTAAVLRAISQVGKRSDAEAIVAIARRERAILACWDALARRFPQFRGKSDRAIVAPYIIERAIGLVHETWPTLADSFVSEARGRPACSS